MDEFALTKRWRSHVSEQRSDGNGLLLWEAGVSAASKEENHRIR
ncbi:hypothetical protein T261_4362 [Streptomyces lydicus]|nr:hypothetical protein T261_4362 [Streptomyces lydicus]